MVDNMSHILVSRETRMTLPFHCSLRCIYAIRVLRIYAWLMFRTRARIHVVCGTRLCPRLLSLDQSDELVRRACPACRPRAQMSWREYETQPRVRGGTIMIRGIYDTEF